MLTVIEGTYENGQVILDHKPKVENKTKVVVIFEEIEMPADTNEKRPFGISKGNITLSPDFNEPLDDLKDYM
ncbi:DUF2281 domain-containing protein [Dyadobacter fanqingshengii]|uniref:DUF2281 domain-containing protein n=1 Tax=Dyadobacter fanqingshengii TaxID=2906443 RepID=A0A9X1PDX8_9BACT|nr:DUF2281 domain-containing protein [Dyadobacter fanqingshengii]MCF0041925.1 DUF2281 domain-containing protein [Dyadobacter fanqingshengii]USJ36369.1 DUF2281 domain-containing protein [Dyadobacter fanqingshengii]